MFYIRFTRVKLFYFYLLNYSTTESAPLRIDMRWFNGIVRGCHGRLMDSKCLFHALQAPVRVVDLNVCGRAKESRVRRAVR